MGPVAVIRRTLTVLRTRPADFFPMYLLGAAVPAIAQIITIVGLVIVYSYLLFTGRLDQFLVQLETADIGPPPDPNSTAFDAWATDLFPLLDILFPSKVLGILFVTVLLSLAVAFILFAIVTAGQLSICLFRLQEKPGLRSALVNAKKHWKSFLLLYLLEALVWAGSSIIVVGIIFSTIGFSSIISGVIALITIPMWLLLVIGTRAVFVFAPVAVVVDDNSVVSSLQEAMRFIRQYPADAVFYFIFSITIIFLYTGVFGIFSSIGAGSLAALGGLLIVSPILDLYKTAVFANARNTLPAISTPAHSLRDQFVHGVIHGWGTLTTFIRSSPVYLFVSLVFLVIGAYSGLWFADPFTPFVTVSIESRIEGLFPVTAAIEFFANNWSVASTVAYAGILIGLPAIILLWVNGVSIGVLYQLEANKLALLGFLLPHGVIEIPAIVIAGATGLFLGVQSWYAWHSNNGIELLEHALKRLFWILVGLGIVFAVAGFIEGFISPVVVELLTVS